MIVCGQDIGWWSGGGLVGRQVGSVVGVEVVVCVCL